MVARPAGPRYSAALFGNSRGNCMARKKRLKIALIGYGAISQTLFDIFREKKPDIDIIVVLVRPGRAKETQKKVGRKVPVVETLKALLKLKPENAKLGVTVGMCGARLLRTVIVLGDDPTLPTATNAIRLKAVTGSDEL